MILGRSRLVEADPPPAVRCGMRISEVDERDSSWEKYDPVFRVYLFRRGEHLTSSWSTWTYDVDGADLLEVAHWAQTEVGDSGLYAIALVSGETLGGPSGQGIVWLIGSDANDEPHTEQETAAHERMRTLRGRKITFS